ncbi:hypothetical protein ACFSM5_13845 [Lacibacterium aquatile]|uniref:DUF4355 domain-containing protein n=1 Tax=Lacibacterium aquatile TaxID=1168082 RepID=A0ABW5DXL2_9PROT
MQILPTTSAASGLLPGIKGDALEAGEELKGETPAEILHEITKDGLRGLMKWQLEELEEKITQEVLASHGLTPESLNALPPEQKMAMMDLIKKEVAERLKQAVDEQLKKEGKAQFALNSAPAQPEALQVLIGGQEAQNNPSGKKNGGASDSGLFGLQSPFGDD